MLRVMLVDNEPNVRQGIKMMIPWEELGMTVIAEGEDGDDGLNKILINNPDIVIADVKMPGMTGIQMIEAAQKSGFSGKSLILSGYSDFTYAREAMSLGVKQFVLKPVDEDELIGCLKAVREEIEAENESRLKLQKGSEYISEQIVRGLLLGESPSDEAAASAYDMYKSFDVAIISSAGESAGGGKSVLLDMVRKRLNEYDSLDIISTDLNGMLAVIFKDWSAGDVRACLEKIGKDYHNRVFITIGRTVHNKNDISRSYREADKLYSNRFLYLHYGVISSEDVASRSAEASLPAEGYARQIFTFMEINDTARIEGSLNEFQDALCRSCCTPEKIKVTCITTVINVKNAVVKSMGEKKAEQFRDDVIIGQIGALNSLFEIIELMKREFTETSNVLYGRTTKSNMERVVQYIQANYGQELRLEMLANIFGYNSAYLGKIFHQYMGDNFNNYLDRIRITEAKRLLEMDEYKVYEVAEMVGYTNINYFHNKFKKYVGVSPLNYKKSCRGEKSSADDGDEEE